MVDLDFYKGKKVLVTGHTGFKGTWLCHVLLQAGAEVIGFAKEPPTNPSLFELTCLSERMESTIGDIRDLHVLTEVFSKHLPEIVIHMAAQPIVRDSYKNPVYTYETNVMGTVNVCECVRKFSSVKSFLNVTTDKVYENKEWEWGYRENENLNGYDPYSNSKSCSELVTHSYKKSFFDQLDVAVSTARAGNVIGGGDFAKDRIIPDCVRSVMSGKDISVRNPYSIRPYQHVLEPIIAYLLICEKQYINHSLQGYYNIGPDEADCITTGELVNCFCEYWGEGQKWTNYYAGGPHEASFLRLDCSKAKKVFNWKPKWNYREAIEKTVEWTKVYQNSGNVKVCMEKQIKDYLMN